MKKFLKQGIAFVVGATIATFISAPSASAMIVGVTGPTSSAGAGNTGEIIGAPTDVLDDFTFNTRMQGFDETQGVTTSSAYSMYVNDGRSVGTLAAGMRVDSHMIFLNGAGNGLLTHEGVVWEFNGEILGVMADYSGNHEAASSGELGAAMTNYAVADPGGDGDAAPFAARGMETGGIYADLFSGIGTNFLTVSMFVTEPGDWIRVVTVSAVPLPAALPLYGAGVALLGFMGWRKRRNAETT